MHAGIDQGDAAAVATIVREHLAAGADQVIAGMPTGIDFDAGMDRLDQPAPTLLEAG